MPEGEVEDISGHYRIIKRDTKSFELQGKNEKDWEDQYDFTTIPREINDYKEMCSFQQDSPTSHFRTRMLCTIATLSGRITLSNNSLTITDNGKKTKVNFDSRDDFSFYLKKHFNIIL